jgi:hypothetical protein
MHEQLDALLCMRYPAIFSAEGSVDQRLFGFDCGDGWFLLIDGACELIQRHIESDGTQQLRALQVKQKFGGLRFYYQHGSDYAAAVVDLTESLSPYICEICGALGKPVSILGWMQTRCPTHECTSVYEEPLLTKVRDELLLAPKMGELLGAALEFFAFDGQAAARWLTQRVAALGNMIPLALAGSEEGQRQVLTLIGRLEHGITP